MPKSWQDLRCAVHMLIKSPPELWTFASLETLIQDVRYAGRILRKSPIFAAVAILSLGLGIGATTAIFSLMDALLLRTLPVRDPQHLALFDAGTYSGTYQVCVSLAGGERCNARV